MLISVEASAINVDKIEKYCTYPAVRVVNFVRGLLASVSAIELD